MKNKSFIGFIIAFLLITVLSSCSTKLNKMRQDVEYKWSSVENQYQRRTDTFKSILARVKQIQEIDNLEQQSQALQQLQAVADEAEALNKIKVDINDEKALNSFISSQDALREKMLNAIDKAKEVFPSIKTNDAINSLLMSLEGSENRITVAKQEYISAVKDYNACVNSGSGKMASITTDHKELPLFQSKDYTTPNLDY